MTFHHATTVMRMRRLFSLVLTTFVVLSPVVALAQTPPPAADSVLSVRADAGVAVSPGTNSMEPPDASLSNKLPSLLTGTFDAHVGKTLEPSADWNGYRKWMDVWFGRGIAKRPFSFIYGGRPSAEFLGGWNVAVRTRTLDTHRIERTLTYTDPATKLEVRCVVVEYLNYPAVEWVLYCKNNGSADTPILESILPLNTTLSNAIPGQPTVYYADGSHVLVTDFQPRQATVTSATTTLSSLGGRSSDGTLPFFNLAQTDGTGIVIGVGWTGQWIAHFTTVGYLKMKPAT